MWTLVWKEIEVFGRFGRSERISFEYSVTWYLNCKRAKHRKKYTYIHICVKHTKYIHIYTNKYPHTYTKAHIWSVWQLCEIPQNLIRIYQNMLSKMKQKQNIGKHYLTIEKYYLNNVIISKFWIVDTSIDADWNVCSFSEMLQNIIRIYRHKIPKM